MFGVDRKWLAGGQNDANDPNATSTSRVLRSQRMMVISIQPPHRPIAHCDIAARDLLLPHGDVLMTLSIVLRIARTLDGAEIDKIISDMEARKALAIEHHRRDDWRKRELSADSFEAACNHVNDASMPHPAPDRVW